MKLFVGHPVAVFIAAVIFSTPCFLKAYSWRSRIIMGIVALIWVLYGFWETYITNWRAPNGDMAIRIDLAIFGPFVLVSALLGVVTVIRGFKRVT